MTVKQNKSHRLLICLPTSWCALANPEHTQNIKQITLTIQKEYDNAPAQKVKYLGKIWLFKRKSVKITKTFFFVNFRKSVLRQLRPISSSKPEKPRFEEEKN